MAPRIEDTKIAGGGVRRRGKHMRRWALFLLLVVLPWAPPVFAQMAECPAQGKGLDPVGFESITVSTVAIGLTAATITAITAAAAYITVETGNGSIRYTLFGTPTAATGHLVDPPSAGNATPGTGTWICGRAALLGLRVIRAAAADAVLRVSYFKQR
jgi:hypothetical protein